MQKNARCVFTVFNAAVTCCTTACGRRYVIASVDFSSGQDHQEVYVLVLWLAAKIARMQCMWRLG